MIAGQSNYVGSSVTFSSTKPHSVVKLQGGIIEGDYGNTQSYTGT